ncbi:hypothetical protein [Deinococcus radiotolerans]|uniref:N-acetyltransferase domain-containing protein n=1 Tax=Deinococcus radiotolerans TaxID=1309407 RepID=A0ABQ2FRI9_9DEIO|nr:hypothetical protein [Deinococcus radiotolerans]GGL19692.1 hypothetical protein GCM10010844_43340 [Deinococcus radiotolerans]
MTLNPDQMLVPTAFVTAHVMFRRQQLEDNEGDYDAVMDSRHDLRVWSDSPWPEDGFTREENAADLSMHMGEHDRDEGYGFSIFRTDNRQFLGSLYFHPVAPFRDHYAPSPHADARLRPLDVRVEYWLRRGTDAALHQDVLQGVQTWLKRDWWFQGVTFGSRRNMHEQRRRYEAAGLTELTQLVARDGERRFHFHVS